MILILVLLKHLFCTDCETQLNFLKKQLSFFFKLFSMSWINKNTLKLKFCSKNVTGKRLM